MLRRLRDVDRPRVDDRLAGPRPGGVADLIGPRRERPVAPRDVLIAQPRRLVQRRRGDASLFPANLKPGDRQRVRGVRDEDEVMRRALLVLGRARDPEMRCTRIVRLQRDGAGAVQRVGVRKRDRRVVLRREERVVIPPDPAVSAGVGRRAGIPGRAEAVLHQKRSVRPLAVVESDDHLPVAGLRVESVGRGERVVGELRRLDTVLLRDLAGERDRVAVADQVLELREVRRLAVHDVREDLVASDQQVRGAAPARRHVEPLDVPALRRDGGEVVRVVRDRGRARRAVAHQPVEVLLRTRSLRADALVVFVDVVLKLVEPRRARLIRGVGGGPLDRPVGIARRCVRAQAVTERLRLARAGRSEVPGDALGRNGREVGQDHGPRRGRRRRVHGEQRAGERARREGGEHAAGVARRERLAPVAVLGVDESPHRRRRRRLRAERQRAAGAGEKHKSLHVEPPLFESVRRAPSSSRNAAAVKRLPPPNAKGTEPGAITYRPMGRLISFLLASTLSFGSLALFAAADEGMWTFDNFPAAKVKRAYGFSATPAFLDHLRKAALRSPGCTASFISPEGLVMTNHHCVLGCVAALSTAQKNLIENGFIAQRREDEQRCPNFDVNQLVAITDVTKMIHAATAGKTGADANAALRAATVQVQQSCGSDATVRCDLVALYHGGIYDVYRYKHYDDVRLVFAPEFAVAQFGGDPDNFNFPRFDLDVGIVRAYENGKPVASSDYLRWSENGSKAGELVFVPGNPGGTSRELTTSELTYERDYALVGQLRGRQ